MKTLFATTALAVLLATGTTMAAQMPLATYKSEASDIRASHIIGQTVYATESTVDTNVAVNTPPEKDWANIGEINEIVLGRDGAVKAVVVGVGGFLGIGEKNVAVSMNDIKFVRDGDAPEDYFLVVNATKDALNSAPAYDNATDPDTTASTTMDNNRTPLARPDVTREGYTAVAPAELTSDKLTGARVYGAKDEDVGEINRLVMNDSGQVKLFVIDVGGFLGMGAREIAVTPDEINIVRDAKGDDFRIYIDANKDTLKAQPEYKSAN